MSKTIALVALAFAAFATTVVPAAAQAPLAGIQDRIFAASSSAATTKKFDGFDRVEAQLATQPASGQAGYYRSYWLAFARYQKSLALMRAGRRDDARTALEGSIATLKMIPTKDVEVNALLGLATGLNLQFMPRPQIVIAAQESGSYVRSSLTNPKPTLRAYYAGAIADWNTPLMYGGHMKAEALAKKAIAASDPVSSIRPTWGRDEAIALLVRIYAAGKRTAEARALLQTGRQRFPDSLALNEVAGEI